MATKVYSPANGKAIKIEKVPDEMFAQKMIGDGIAIRTNDKELYSPIEGEVKMVFETGHAVGIVSDDGSEFMIHIGIDTVQLNGEPFKTMVKLGDHVTTDTLISIVDWNCIRKHKKDDSVIIISLNKPVQILNKQWLFNIKRKDLLYETKD